MLLHHLEKRLQVCVSPLHHLSTVSVRTSYLPPPNASCLPLSTSPSRRAPSQASLRAAERGRMQLAGNEHEAEIAAARGEASVMVCHREIVTFEYVS